MTLVIHMSEGERECMGKKKKRVYGCVCACVYVHRCMCVGCSGSNKRCENVETGRGRVHPEKGKAVGSPSQCGRVDERELESQAGTNSQGHAPPLSSESRKGGRGRGGKKTGMTRFVF